MYGVTRAMLTLIGVAVAGFLIWLATQVFPDDLSLIHAGDYWLDFGFVALGGLDDGLFAASGRLDEVGLAPSVGQRLLDRLPANPYSWLLDSRRRRAWKPLARSGMFVAGRVTSGSRIHWKLTTLVPAIAFGIGLVYGFTFDTTGPRIPKRMQPVPAAGAQPPAAATDGVSDDRRIHIGDGSTADAPAPEPAPRAGEPTES